MFPFAVSFKVGALERNANWFHVELIFYVILGNNLNSTSEHNGSTNHLAKISEKTREKMSTNITDI